MFIGALSALLATAITIGILMDAAMYNISHIRASPAEAVAVAVLAPAAAAPMHSVMAECSLSEQTNSVSTSPFATYSEKSSTMIVCGVMG